MTNSVKNIKADPVNVELDRTRGVIFDLNAFAMIEDHYPNTEAAFDAMSNNSVKALRVILWAGLQRDAADAGETLTLEDTGRLVDTSNMAAVANAIGEAMLASMPEDQAAKIKAAQAGGQGNAPKGQKKATA